VPVPKWLRGQLAPDWQDQAAALLDNAEDTRVSGVAS
jgi:hypothetical protein